MREYSETIPVQYEEGRASFMGNDIIVDERVFIPRPETELLVRVAADMLKAKGREDASVLDMCTGSGAVAVSLARRMPDACIMAADISEEALRVTRANIERCSLGERVMPVESDMFSFFASGYREAFDAIVSNPPYVSSEDYEKLDAWVLAEPRIALWSGDEGMDHINVLARESSAYLTQGGFIAIEIGYDQADRVKRVLSGNGFRDISSHRDFNGHERVVTGVKHG